MKIFLDTSVLFKLYYFESGSDEIENFINSNDIETIFVSDITKLEFSSTVWKKVRNKEIEESDALAMINRFEKDQISYTFIPVDIVILQRARFLLTKYGLDGLRTLDSIQFSSCIEIKDECYKYFTADKLLLTLFTKEALPI